MLDTNILIYFIKRRPPQVAQRINALGANDTPCMSFVSYAELLKGAEGSVHKAEVMRGLDTLVRQIPVLYPQAASICEHYAVQATRLKRAGTPVGGNDLWIGCHALAEGAVLVTNNTAELARIDGLAVENWA